MSAAPHPVLSEALARKLRSVDTPTICNALELAMGGRSAQGFTRGTLVAAPQPMAPMLGFARTACIRAAQPSTRPAADMRQLRLDYYRHVAPVNGVPTLVVMQDLDEHPGIGSFWGEVNSAVHEGLGVAGVLTNGSVRDLGDLSPRFPILAGSIGPSHAFVHVERIGEPVEVFGLRVAHDDLIHADRHGAVLISPCYLQALPECIDRVQRKEAPLLAAARGPGFNLAKIEAAMREADDIH
ncbi:RraA family protein [Variovorax sp. RCC_210]|uniref:RraA family protein n=1 Tax=Variovorax sp. RCC_210 TaxID=3239217 RepID=UPI0035235586